MCLSVLESPDRSRERVVDARRLHRRPRVVHRMRQQHEVAQLPVAVAHVVAQQPLGLEAEAAEHRHRTFLLSDDLDGELAQPAVERLQQRPARERAAEALPAAVGVDHEAHLADVIRPAGEADDRDVADHAAVVREGQGAAATVAGEPALDGGAVEHRLLEERALGLGDPAEEPQQLIEVVARRLADHPSSSECSLNQPAIPGSVTFAALRPATSPACPAASRSSSFSSEPTRPSSGSAAASGTMWSRSAMMFSTGRVIAVRSTRSPPSSNVPSTSPLVRTSPSTVWAKAAPGNGMWSRVHWPIAW